MAVAAKETKTRQDYEALEEGAPYQLINGKLVMSPSPSHYHQRAVAELSFAFQQFVKEHELGIVLQAPLDVYLGETEAYQPNILFISNERADIIEERIEGAPDLVVEILSPATGYALNESEEVPSGCYDLTHKKRIYQESGVQEYWIVDPMEKTVEVLWNSGKAFEEHSAARAEGAVQSRLLEGFTVAMDALFAQRSDWTVQMNP